MSRRRQSLPFKQILAVPGAEQAARDHDFSVAELLLVEFAASDLENNMRGYCADGRGIGWRGDVMCGQGEDRLVVRKGDSKDIHFRARDFDFFGPARLRVFDSFFGRLGGTGADGGFIPIVGNVGFGKVVLNIDLGRCVRVSAVIGFGIDQG